MDSPVAEGVMLGGRYRLGPVLGRGGMAQVFGGQDMRLGRPVAIKLLLPELAVNSDLRARFEREAQAAARLSHPNVVGVYDAGEDAGQAYIIMERLGGESLADIIDRGPVDVIWLRRLASDVLAALTAAHSAGIVHRDIKPANILMAAAGRAKVADFGIARVIEEQAAPGTEDDLGLTATGLIIGTPAYLAPERMLGQPATPQSDLYSVGVVLYEALTGRKPFQGTTPVAVAAAASLGAAGAPDPASLRPDADPVLVAAIARAMAPDPALRFPSAAAMASALRLDTASPTAILEAPPAAQAAAAATVPIAGSAAPVGPAGQEAVERSGRWRRPGVALAAAGAIVIAAVAALDLAGGHSVRARATDPVTSSTLAGPATTPAPAPAPRAAGATTAPAPTATPPTGNSGVDLQQLISQLSPAAGPGYEQLVTGLARLAGLPANSQPGYAQALVIQAGNWLRSGQLTDAAYHQVVPVLTAIANPQSSSGSLVTKPGKGNKGGGGSGD